jgi:hypothetical protein
MSVHAKAGHTVFVALLDLHSQFLTPLLNVQFEPYRIYHLPAHALYVIREWRAFIPTLLGLGKRSFLQP